MLVHKEIPKFVSDITVSLMDGFSIWQRKRTMMTNVNQNDHKYKSQNPLSL